jgi:hypothetical protein
VERADGHTVGPPQSAAAPRAMLLVRWPEPSFMCGAGVYERLSRDKLPRPPVESEPTPLARPRPPPVATELAPMHSGWARCGTHYVPVDSRCPAVTNTPGFGSVGMPDGTYYGQVSRTAPSAVAPFPHQ